jgi:DNA-binding response OmpR family regulator
MSGCRVLIVDDNAGLAETMAGILADEGLDVDVASSGAQALIAWRTQPAQLVLVDVDLPDIEGIRLARRLAGRGGCSLLVMSARDPQGVVRQCEELGAVFLAKPFTPSRLLATVRAVLEKRRRARKPKRAASSRRLLGPRKPRALLQHSRRRKRTL